MYMTEWLESEWKISRFREFAVEYIQAGDIDYYKPYAIVAANNFLDKEIVGWEDPPFEKMSEEELQRYDDEIERYEIERDKLSKKMVEDLVREIA